VDDGCAVMLLDSPDGSTLQCSVWRSMMCLAPLVLFAVANKDLPTFFIK